MKWMQAVCRNFRADLQGFIAATAAVISFDARDAQNGCRTAAEINAGFKPIAAPLTRNVVCALRARRHAARGPMELMVE
jgi:hypothetical protein